MAIEENLSFLRPDDIQEKRDSPLVSDELGDVPCGLILAYYMPAGGWQSPGTPTPVRLLRQRFGQQVKAEIFQHLR